MNGILLDLGVVIAEIILFLIAITVGQFLIILTLKRLAQWVPEKQGQNPLNLTQKILNKSLFVIKITGAIIIAALNGYLFLQQKSPYLYLLDLINGISPEQWQRLALGLLKSVLLLLLVSLMIASLRPRLKRAGDRLKAWKNIEGNNHSLDTLFKAIDLAIANGLWILALVVCLNFLFVPPSITQYFYLAIKVYFLLCFGIIAVRASFSLLDTLDGLSTEFIAKHPRSPLRFYPRFRYLLGLTKRCLETGIYLAIAGVICAQFPLLDHIAPYAIPANQIILIIFIAALVIELSNIIVEKLLLRSPNLSPVQQRRRLTFIPLVQNTVRYCIYFVSGVSILYVFDIDPTPILAGAGILGLAVGLGAQNLINDLVNGFSILLQNYYLVGDFVETDNATGLVEEMDLRVTRIRDTGGRLHIIRNGDIKTIVNYSKDYVYSVVYVGVAYDSDLDHVYQVLGDVGHQIQGLHPDVLEPTRIDGLDNFAESELTIRTVTKVKPGKHLPVQRLLRKLIKEAFDREQIEIPFARRVLIFKNEAPGLDSLRDSENM
ncbi:mechanosensitive ion channel family protein [Picosynechococcus sp. PCC 73109]|uniref:mechanosensitive ion channel family protein n=1 Tax=Picosynechococcus sp. PCC 73109 TaxID=374982 RepID=UPI00074586B6|nr:mechanosensitive ion channel family protein [Picosynechococcus sp. PCC 73109]AMA08900.1 mechanosensitive ion channel family protein [Picosynechococcus sp. PCC 73109]